jgi:tetratricopeptide (TPR) repeat protein
MYAGAAAAYDRLSRATGTTIRRDDALTGYMSAMILSGDLARIVEAAENTLARAQDKNLVRETQYTRAVALSRLGRDAEALAIFRTLGADVSNSEGAESAYRVIEAARREGNNAEAERLVYAFAEKNTPYAYWLGKAFLVLGDIYADAGDTFQARATWQSIVDGYLNKDDGIVADAAERIKNLR